MNSPVAHLCLSPLIHLCPNSHCFCVVRYCSCGRFSTSVICFVAPSVAEYHPFSTSFLKPSRQKYLRRFRCWHATEPSVPSHGERSTAGTKLMEQYGTGPRTPIRRKGCCSRKDFQGSRIRPGSDDTSPPCPETKRSARMTRYVKGATPSALNGAASSLPLILFFLSEVSFSCRDGPSSMPACNRLL